MFSKSRYLIQRLSLALICRMAMTPALMADPTNEQKPIVLKEPSLKSLDKKTIPLQ